jgi:uroporphyrin-3 C-methyltransferase
MSKHDSSSDKEADTEGLSSDKKADTEGLSSDKETDTEGLPSDKEADTEGLPSDKDAGTGGISTDPDPVQLGDAAADDEPSIDEASDTESGSAAESESSPKALPEPKVRSKPRRSWLSLLNFLLILALAGAAGYYWWQQQQVSRDNTASISAIIAELEQQLASKAANARLDASLSPLKGDIDNLGSKLDELSLGQQGLRDSSEKLYELFGRDKSDWQLAEVEYLMRVAQHKLILQDDFEGAAITLQAASDKIGLTGDPGLLPVRVMISEEIAELKTRKRADLVGMTLILAQLGRQVRVLEPGFAVRVDTTESAPIEVEVSQDWLERFTAFIDSLVTVRNEATRPSEIEANIVDVGASLEDNLKLARWAVLERDASQYQLLLEQSLRLFREFYDLDNAANHDFMTQLQDLQKMVLKPEKPDINGSLRELQRILSQRENAPSTAPEPTTTEITEPGNG